MEFSSGLKNALLGSVLFLFLHGGLFAQEKSELDSLYDELDVLFEEADLPAGLLAKADSLFALMDLKYHSLGVRAGYLSNVLTAGRDLGIDQHGFNAGLSYFHPSGMFIDLSGYWNSEYDPSYYLTNTGIGYMHEFNEHWNASIGHDFMFYDNEIDFIFDKAARLSGFYQSKNWEAGLDYRYLYGRESAHRLVALLNGRLTWREVGGIDRISFIPGVSVQTGNATVQYYQQSETPVQDLFQVMNQEGYPELSNREFLRLSYLIYKGNELRSFQFLRERGFTVGQIDEIIRNYQDTQLVTNNAFGLMNIALNCGISVSEKNWNLYLSYTYNFPFALPGETFNYPQNDYASISILYTLVWPAR